MFLSRQEFLADSAYSMEAHQQDRDARDATRKAAWESSARGDDLNRSMQNMSVGRGKSSLAERSKYQFEADSEDEEMENEIDSNLGMMIVSIAWKHVD